MRRMNCEEFLYRNALYEFPSDKPSMPVATLNRNGNSSRNGKEQTNTALFIKDVKHLSNLSIDDEICMPAACVNRSLNGEPDTTACTEDFKLWRQTDICGSKSGSQMYEAGTLFYQGILALSEENVENVTTLPRLLKRDVNSTVPKPPTNWVEKFELNIGCEMNQTDEPITTVESAPLMSTFPITVPPPTTFNSNAGSNGQQARADSPQNLAAASRSQIVSYINEGLISLQAISQKQQKDHQQTCQQNLIQIKKPLKLDKESTVLVNPNNSLQTPNKQNFVNVALNSTTVQGKDYPNATPFLTELSGIRGRKPPRKPKIAAKFDLPYQFDYC